MTRKVYTILFVLTLSHAVVAQNDAVVSELPPSLQVQPSVAAVADSASPWEVHLTLGGAVVGNSRSVASLYSITPTILYRPSDRLKIKASVSAVESFALTQRGGFRGQSAYMPYVPGSHVAAAANISVAYKASDRLWIAGSFHHFGGSLASASIVAPWFPSDAPMELNANAYSASLRYRFGNDNYLTIHLNVIDDRTGAMGPILFGSPYGSYGYYSNTTFGSHLYYDPF